MDFANILDTKLFSNGKKNDLLLLVSDKFKPTVPSKGDRSMIIYYLSNADNYKNANWKTRRSGFLSMSASIHDLTLLSLKENKFYIHTDATMNQYWLFKYKRGEIVTEMYRWKPSKIPLKILDENYILDKMHQ